MPLAIEDWATVIIMGLLACITFANVLVRYFTDSSFAWTEEFSVFLMILLALVAGSAAVARDRHIRIEYFAESGSMARRKRLAQFGALMVAAAVLPDRRAERARGLGRLPLRGDLARHRRAAVVVLDLAADRVAARSRCAPRACSCAAAARRAPGARPMIADAALRRLHRC